MAYAYIYGRISLLIYILCNITLLSTTGYMVIFTVHDGILYHCNVRYYGIFLYSLVQHASHPNSEIYISASVPNPRGRHLRRLFSINDRKPLREYALHFSISGTTSIIFIV